MALCECGCGEDAGIYPRTHSQRGILKGAPRRYLPSHNRHGRVSDHGFTVADHGYETPCHIWLGASNQNGYGLIKVGRSSRAAHRVYWEREYGPVPAGRELDHLCRVRACVRVDHLESVSHTENVRRGLLAKLTADDVARVQAAAEGGTLSCSALAALAGISRPTVRVILAGEHWTQRQAV